MNNKITYKMKPSFDKDRQILTVDTTWSGLIEKFSREQIDFKDECVKNALIELGWTPPKD